MKILIFIIVLFFYSGAFGQIEWRQILNQSVAYYSNKKSGTVEFSTAEKNALKNDTNYYSQLFLYSKNPQNLGKLFYNNDKGFSIYVNSRTYYIYTSDRTYYIGENKSYDHLKFLPYWDPTSFFFEYFKMGEKYGVGVELNQDSGHYILNFTNNDDGKFVLHIDKITYNIARYTEIYTHKKFGDQYTEYAFQEQSGSDGPDSILNELDLVLKNFTRTTDETLKNAAKTHKNVKQKITGSKINKTELNMLLFGDNSAGYTGSYILLDYFYQTCLPCIKAIPELNELRTRFDTSRLMIIGVDPIPADAGQKEKFIKRYGVSYPVIDGEQAVAVRNISLPGLAIYYPTLVLIKPDGTIVKILEYYSKSHFTDLAEFLKKAF